MAHRGWQRRYWSAHSDVSDQYFGVTSTLTALLGTCMVDASTAVIGIVLVVLLGCHLAREERTKHTPHFLGYSSLGLAPNKLNGESMTKLRVCELLDS
jgi:hypothetical protein